MKDEAKKYGRQWAYPLVGVRFSRFVFAFLNSSFILPHSSLLLTRLGRLGVHFHLLDSADRSEVLGAVQERLDRDEVA